MKTPRLLIADDEAINLRTLAETLRDIGEITIAKNGAEAYERACASPPDLLLLDIDMPELNGYEVCRRIRSLPALQNVPVIFITTLDAEEDETRGFEAGGTDYITKPFSPAITLARVKTQLELKRHRDDLETLAETRARQLVHAERLATLGTLAAGIAHEINNPLACIMGYAEFMLSIRETIKPETLHIEPDHPAAPLLSFASDAGEYLSAMVDAADRINRIVTGMKSHSKREDETFQLTHPEPCINNALNLCAYQTKSKARVTVDLPPDLPQALMRPQQIEQVLINLINNAAHAIGQTGHRGTIHITGQRAGERLELSVRDTGPGIPPEHLETIWEAFYTSKGEEGTGLGLAISRGIIEEHGGEITVCNAPEGGALFTISLPAGPAN